uniref:Uncharacterized protein n=1 Tax=Brassica oleracea var. oleracea TaxID=109376 RepID=A0A0D3CVQ7_BRAOL
MAPRKKPAAPTYSQLFGDGSGASSSGPSSSDAVPDSQTSQRVSSSPHPPPQLPPPPPPTAAPQPAPAAWTEEFGSSRPRRVSWSPPPPPQMPPPPPPAVAPQPAPTGAVHPDLRVPSYAPYARYTVEDLLLQPRREGLEVLDPDRPPGTFWFGANNRVSRSISETIKGYYDGAYPNWSITPDHLEKTRVLPSLSELFKKLFHAVAARIEERETQLTQQSPDRLPATFTEEADRIFSEVDPKKKGRTVGICSVNEVARVTSSYTSRRDEETSQMKARMDSQQVCLDSLRIC